MGKDKRHWVRPRVDPPSPAAVTMAEQDQVDPEGGVKRWVLIGHSLHQHYRVRKATVDASPGKIDVHRAACGYSYQKGFEVIPEGDCGLPHCPQCLAVMAETARAAGVHS